MLRVRSVLQQRLQDRSGPLAARRLQQELHDEPSTPTQEDQQAAVREAWKAAAKAEATPETPATNAEEDTDLSPILCSPDVVHRIRVGLQVASQEFCCELLCA